MAQTLFFEDPRYNKDIHNTRFSIELENELYIGWNLKVSLKRPIDNSQTK